MHIIIRRLNVTIALLAGCFTAAVGFLHPVQAASVGAGGYTNDFSLQPAASDWSTYSVGGGAGDITSSAGTDGDVQAVGANAIIGPLVANGTVPPDFNAVASWASTGFYVQTRATGNRTTILMCTLINNLGVDASAATISYDYNRTLPVVEEVDGHRAFYSLSGAAGSWTPLPQFFTTTPGRLSANLSITWPNGSPLYIVWGDDNGSGSPDTAYQIDNFSATATPAFQLPVTITNQPQSRTVGELKPVSFSVGLSGYLPPTVQWYSNNVAIPGATSTTYSIAAAPLGYNGLNFKAVGQNVASNVTYNATSSVATLTVTADTTAPALVSVSSAGLGAIAIAFSEPLRIDTATNLVNYLVTNSGGSLVITSAVLSADQTNVTLFTVAQTLGSQYTVIINGIRDQAVAANLIAPNSVGNFETADFAANNIGNPAIPGSVTNVPGGYNISGAGTNFGGASDQFNFAAQIKAGNFDVRVRVADLGITDPWAKAAIMARESLNTNSVFAAAVASPHLAGCFFQTRTNTGVNSRNSGTFPANYPNMWLRLQRSGNTFTGYAGADGSTWVPLGSVTLAIGNVYLGFAVTSFNPAQATTAEFREYTNVDTNTAVVAPSLIFASEQLNAAARTGPMVISEIMYKPGGVNTNLEYVELYNSNPFFEDISGYRLSGDIDFTFPPNTIVQAGTFVVVARDPAALQSAYGITGVFGPYSNSLPASGTVRLRSDVNAILLQVDYTDENPWPVGADGTGHSLVLARPSYGQNVPRSWDTSDRVGGSPGAHEPLRMKTGQRAVVINEVLAHTDLPQVDYIELYNYSMQPVDISGCYLSDAASTNKFRIPSNTTLLPHGYISFNEATLGFALGHRGETIYFRSADGTRMLDALQYEPQENGVAFGRYPDGSPEFYRLSALTAGTTNAPFLVNDIVINEIMYAPISEEDDDEYIELYNKGTNAVNIGGWRFTSGIDLTFPPNTIIQPDGYVVVARNSTHLLAHYANLTPANTFGNYDGQLSRDGERLALAKPDYDFITNGNVITTNVDYIVVEEVTYGTGGRWGQWANQGGSSLELIDPRSNRRLAYNWGDSDETSKSQWTYFYQTGLLDTGDTQGGSPINRLEVIMLGEGECLLDDVEVHSPLAGANLVPNFGFESGLSPWVPQGNHIYSTLESSFEAHTGNNSLHVRSDGNGDTGANRVRVALNTALTINQMATVKGYVRWLRGWPEITLRIKGGHLEAYGRMQLPTNLGSPGARNSRALTNNAPALHGVVHSPALPQANEPAVVTAGVHDPDGVANVVLFYRVDANTPPAFTTLAMNDNGVSGDAIARDGIYSGMIPAQAPGTMISFYVEATDTRSATSQFPKNAVVTAVDGQRRECLVRWGDPIPVSAFSTYRMWLSRANVNTYVNRPALSNMDVDGTMIVNNNRVIYNISSHYSNSPYHQTQNGSPETGGQHFTIHLPLDDKYLGTENFNKVHAPGNASFEDNNWLREQTAYWVARKAGMPYLYRRFVAMYVNGTRKAGSNAGPDALMEDTQRPGGELIDEFFPDETEGRLFKLQPWFEFDDVTVANGTTAAGFDNERWCTLMPNLSTNAHKISRYRQNYLTRSADKTANDYTNVIALINAANLPTTHPSYWQNLSSLIDVDQWAHIFAVEHAVGNWDSFGGVNAQNMYGYKPINGKWKLMIWDFNIVLNNAAGNPGGAGPGTTSNPPGGNLFDVQSGQDPNMAAMELYPPFRRAWWRAYKELTVGPNAPMLAANCNPLIDAKYAAFRASGLNTPGPAASVKGFLSTAQTTIAAAVAGVDVNGFGIGTPSVTATTSNIVTISGTATFDVTDIEFNGVSWPITWTTITAWSVRVPVTNSTQVAVVAYDKNRNVIGGTNNVTVTYAVPLNPDPRGLIIFNEIMYNPSTPDAEYVELYNMHTNFAFNVSGWRINGLSYTFPDGSFLPPRSYIVLAKDRVRFNVAYGPTIPVLDQYTGSLQGNGETLSLIKPAASSNEVDVVVDKVRYDSTSPWPVAADGTGSSIQLIDPNQDNARVANWFANYVPAVLCCGVSEPARTNDGWQFVTSSGSIGSGSGGGQMRLVIYLGTELGTAIIDDVAIVAGTNAGVGPNFVRNGDFEGPLTEDPPFTNSWMVGTNYTPSTIISSLTHAGNGALLLEPTTFGNSVTITATTTNNRVIYQALSPAPAMNSINTLSFWYWATNSSTNLNIKIVNSAANTVNVLTNINITYVPSNYVPPQVVSPATNSLTPGAANQNVTALPAFPPLWINEVQAENITGLTDNNGQREPWIEIYNTSSNAVSLDGLFLSSSYTNLTNWAFPPGASIGPTQFLVVFCDAQPAQTSGNEYHTSFRLPATSGSVALSRLYTNAPQVLDYINYAGLHADKSYGSYPDGQPFDRQEFFYVTPRGTNDGRAAPLVVSINEWMASNVSGQQDPADGAFDDWFEIFNPGSNTVNLAGYYLTDTLADPFKFAITTNMAHTIPPGGHLLVWADNEVGQNLAPGGVIRPDLHVNFQLAKAGEALGIFGIDGLAINSVTFGLQTDNVSAGRIPDGGANIVAMPGSASPRAANYLVGPANNPPTLNPIGNKSVNLGATLTFTATASDTDLPAQILIYDLVGAPAGATIVAGTGAFSWTPTLAGTFPVTVRVTDNGAPPASDSETIQVTVTGLTFGGPVRRGNNLELTWGTQPGTRYAVDQATNLNTPIVWQPVQTNTAAGTSLSYTNATTNGVQRFFRVRSVP